VSQLGLDVLAAIDVSVSVPSAPMNGVRVLSAGTIGETLSPMGICVRRIELDAHLLELARRDGVVVEDGDGLTSLERGGAGFVLGTTKGRSITARFVAACDGAGSTTRKLLGLREAERKGHLYVLDTDVLASDSGVKRGLVDFDLSVLDEGLPGYYWDFPTVVDAAPQVSRGIYDANLTREETSRRTKDVLATSLGRRGIDIERVRLRPFSTRPFVHGSTTWVRGVVLVGEACGIDQTTGEGIAQAIDMGRMAARHLADAVRTGSPRFYGYDRELRGSTTGRHLLQSAWLARRVYGRFGGPARRYLLDSSYARDAAMRWYRGESLPWSMQLRLGIGLAASAVDSKRFSPASTRAYDASDP
jgi:flavin-dependent dehydrogenase